VSLLVNRWTRGTAALLHSAGLAGVNRVAKQAAWRILGSRAAVDADGLRIAGPADSWSTLSQLGSGLLEPYEMQLFTAAVQPGMTVLDLGANIGAYTLFAARAAGPEGEIYAFEPDPRTRGYLVRNIEANGFENVRVVPAAASDRAGIAEFVQAERAVDSSLHGTDESGPRGSLIQVETVPVDDLVGDGRVDVIKMDIEGNEQAALRGMRRVLANNPHLTLFMELNPGALREAGTDPAEFVLELEDTFEEVLSIEERMGALRSLAFDENRRVYNLCCRKVRADR
jgi:FkbM family methyltransferase